MSLISHRIWFSFICAVVVVVVVVDGMR